MGNVIENRYEIAQVIAAGATVCSVVGMIGNHFLNGNVFFAVLIAIGFCAGIISYVFGGLGTAIKMVLEIAKWGWFVVPFPYDIAIGMMTAVLAILALVFFPIIPVHRAYVKHLEVRRLRDF